MRPALPVTNIKCLVSSFLFYVIAFGLRTMTEYTGAWIKYLRILKFMRNKREVVEYIASNKGVFKLNFKGSLLIFMDEQKKKVDYYKNNIS